MLRELEIRAAEDPGAGRKKSARPRRSSVAGNGPWTTPGVTSGRPDAPEVLRGQLADWQLGNDLDEYLAAMQASILTLTSVKEQNTATAWLAWAKEYRQSIDPLAKPLAMPPVPKPKPDELKPYLVAGTVRPGNLKT